MAGWLRKVLSVIAVAGVAVAGLVAYDRGREPVNAAAMTADAAVEGPIQLGDFEVTTVQPQQLVRSIPVSGSAAPRRRAALTAEVSGRLADIAVEVGQKVEAGEVLARFDETTLRSALESRQATLEARDAQRRLAESTLERSRRLGSAGISSDADLLAAESDLLNLQAQVRALQADVADAQKALADAIVTAPFAGVVSQRSVEPGQAVPMNAELFQLVDLSQMEIAAPVPASRIAEVAVGQSATLRVEGVPGRRFTARVARIAPTAEAGSRAISVFLTLDNADEILRGGMFAVGEIAIQNLDDVVALPPAAIRRDAAGAFVLKAVDGRLRRQDVATGAALDDRGLVVVAQGLRAGDVVVTAPLPDLQPDTNVEIASAGPGPA